MPPSGPQYTQDLSHLHVSRSRQRLRYPSLSGTLVAYGLRKAVSTRPLAAGPGTAQPSPHVRATSQSSPSRTEDLILAIVAPELRPTAAPSARFPDELRGIGAKTLTTNNAEAA